MRRRSFIAGTGAALAAGVVPVAGSATAGKLPLEMPPLLDTTGSGRVLLDARKGVTNFLGGAATATLGYNQGYLGPTIVMRNGALAAEVTNAIDEAVTVHWHGLLVPGEHDGGGHTPIEPGTVWRADMQIDQPSCTAWYHSHLHGRTAPQVYAGLAGVVHVTDGRDDARGLPSTYGVDDLTLVIQDKRFDPRGRMIYQPDATDIGNGFLGTRVLVNGQADRVAVVPKGLVRLRFLNGSNARIYTLVFTDNRPMHLIGTDGGYLDKPIPLTIARVAPGERIEVLVDFSDGGSPTLMSRKGETIRVIEFATDGRLPVRITRLPEVLDMRVDKLGPPVVTRRFSLTMGGGSQALAGAPGQMAHGTGGMMHDFGINERPFDMRRIDFDAKLGTVERWMIGGGGGMDHPFHVHGVHFRVESEGGGAGPRPESRGWKDTVVTSGEAVILVRFDLPADPKFPYMYHCHILEHEDAGMMGQFSVT